MFIRKIITNIFFIIIDFGSILFQTREKRIANILVKKNIKLSTAESCTGGLLSSRLTDISGSSEYTFQNFVTYANNSKINQLGVKSETIKKYGVVSEEVALEMVQGLLKKEDCNLAVSTTGIAGPTGGTATKPVGLICIGIGNKDIQKTFSFKANPLLFRRNMKYAFSNKVFDLLIDFLNKNYKS